MRVNLGKRYMKQNTYILLCIVLIALTSCNSIKKNEMRDNGILTNNPCSAPCWQNIKIGETSKEDAVDQLQQLSFIDSTSTATIYITYLGDRIETPHDGIQAKCKEPMGKVCALIAFKEDKVASIALLPNYKITFSEYVQYLGDPDKVFFNQPNRSNKSIHFSCEIELSWESKLIKINYLAENNTNQNCEDFKENNQPDQNLEIHSIVFYSKPVDPYAREENITVYPWTGFSTK